MSVYSPRLDATDQNFLISLPFPKRQILDSSKMKEFADDNFELEEHGKKVS